MDHARLEPRDLVNLAWAAAWLIAVAVLFLLALRLPLRLPAGRVMSWMVRLGFPVGAIAIAVLANLALTLHDVHFDVTVEKRHTPSPAAVAVVDGIDRPVKLTYLYQGQDPAAQRARRIVELMGRRNPLLAVEVIDPDKKPALSARYGTRLYNTAVLESEGRRVVVPTVDETEISIGIQRVLRKQVIAICFIEGHNEYSVDNQEFHTHLENANDHSHGDASSKVIETTGHGVGRLRRALESVGYEVRRITPAIGGIPASCSAVIDANPRNTWLPGESAALASYLEQGGAALLLFDLGFSLEPRLEALLGRFGVTMPHAVIVDPRDHYGTDPEMVAVTGYDPHPVTRSVSLTFFPGARPLLLGQPENGLKVTPIVVTGRESTIQPIEATHTRLVTRTATRVDAGKQPRVVAAAIEGRLGKGEPRIIVSGDSDFASNSFLPYMANSDLAVSMVRWLVREEKTTPIASRIAALPLVLLTKSQMQLIFALVEVLLPLLVVAIGAGMWWRRR